MLQTLHVHPPRRRTLHAFTLIELLVVIGIIAVLMGILIPVVAHIRTSAHAAATQSQILVLQAGIEQYRQTFEAYPGPLADSQLLTTANPAGLATGSENLVFGLLGGLSLSGGAVTYTPARVGSGPVNLNPLKAQTYQPFVDPISAGLDPIKSGGNWVVWSDANAHNAGVLNQSNFKDTPAPEFVDRFPDALPILYIRARLGANGVVKSPSVSYPAASTAPAYDAGQLVPYTFPDLGSAPNADFPDPQHYFGTIADQNIPRQRDGFLLISAGIDRTYGTSDDLTNGGKLK